MKLYPIASQIAKVCLKYSQILNKPLKVAKYILKFAKAAKFRQIWSHCP